VLTNREKVASGPRTRTPVRLALISGLVLLVATQEWKPEKREAVKNLDPTAWRRRSGPSIQAPVLNRFCDVGGLDLFRARKISDRAADFEHAAVSPRA